MDDPIVRLGEDGAVWQDRGPAGWYSISGGWARDLAGLHEEYGQTRELALVPVGAEPDLWQYAVRIAPGPDGIVPFLGKPDLVMPYMLRRPLRAAGPWQPVPTTPTTEEAS